MRQKLGNKEQAENFRDEVQWKNKQGERRVGRISEKNEKIE